MNVLFDKESLQVVGLNRPALPYEIEVKNIDITGLSKSVTYFEDTPKTDEEGNQLYLLPQEPIEVEVMISERVQKTEASEEPVMSFEVEKKPLLDEDGNQVEYEVTQVVVTPATYDEEGNLLTEETSEVVGAGIFHKCYTSEEIEYQVRNGNNQPLYWHTVEVPSKELREQSPLQITSEDSRWTESLEEATSEVERSKVVSFEESQDEFTYEDIASYKEKGLVSGTFFSTAKLYEDPASVIDTGLVSFKADIGFGFISLPAGGEARTIKLTLPSPSSLVGIHFEGEGLSVEVGRLASSLVALNERNEVKLDQEASEVYVRFTNPTDKRIDLSAFAVLV